MLRQIIILTGLVLFSASYCQTTFKANQKVSGVWDKEHSPYIIQDRVFIEKGEQLIIKPGVIIELNAAYAKEYSSSQSKKSENRGSIVVNGTLIANGTASDSILFTKTGYNPYWGSIYFYGEEKSEMSCCIIENSGGIYDLTGPNIDAFGAITIDKNNSAIKNIHIRKSLRGLCITGKSSPAIDSVRLSEIKKDAILIKERSTPEITNFLISKCANGVFGQDASLFKLNRGVIKNCKYAGVRVDDHSDYHMENVVVLNSKFGVRIDDSNPEISHCNIIQNRVSALVIKGYADPIITKSILWDNTMLFEIFQSIDINQCLLQEEIAEIEISRNAYDKLNEKNHFGAPVNMPDLSTVLIENPATSIELMFENEKITVGVISEK